MAALAASPLCQLGVQLKSEEWRYWRC